MSEKNNELASSMFENNINSVLSSETHKNALNFAAFLRENDMTAGGAHGEVTYQNKCVCYIHLDGAEQKPGPWTIWTEGDYSSEHEDVLMDERMKEIAWANVNFCAKCGGGCDPGKSQTILGKAFDNVCSAAMAFNNPNAETLECVQKLMIMRKNVIGGFQNAKV